MVLRRRITHPTIVHSGMRGFTALLMRSSDVVEEEEEAVVVDIRATTLTTTASRVTIEAVGVDAVAVDEEAVAAVVGATRATGRLTTRMNTAKGDSCHGREKMDFVR
jgi:hypothetical protein